MICRELIFLENIKVIVFWHDVVISSQWVYQVSLQGKKYPRNEYPPRYNISSVIHKEKMSSQWVSSSTVNSPIFPFPPTPRKNRFTRGRIAHLLNVVVSLFVVRCQHFWKFGVFYKWELSFRILKKNARQNSENVQKIWKSQKWFIWRFWAPKPIVKQRMM